MAITVDMLKSRIAHIRQELEDVSTDLDSLAEAPAPRTAMPPRTGEADRSALLAALDAAYAEMGVDLSEPAITAEELQALMLEEGVRPEDNILSSGIIAAREE
jgi:trans-2-enoyl-CoA reductase